MIDVMIISEDEQYVHYLTSYARNSEMADKMSLAGFTQIEPFLQHIGKLAVAGSQMLILAEEALADRLRAEQIHRPIVWLSDSTDRTDDEWVRIPKYQPLNQLFAQFILLHEQGISPSRSSHQEQRGKSIAVYSASGGAGKTVVAINLARQLAEQGQSVMLINLELVSSLPVFFPDGETEQMAELLYWARTKPDQLEQKIEQIKRYDHATKVNYIPSPRNVREMMEMTADDVEIMMSRLARCGVYDAVIADLPSTAHDRVWRTLYCCDRILWIVGDDALGRHKAEIHWSEMRRLEPEMGPALTEKVYFLLNKCKGKQMNGIRDKRRGEQALPIFAELPYIPEWKHAAAGEAYLGSPVYQNSISQVISTLNQEGVRSGR